MEQFIKKTTGFSVIILIILVSVNYFSDAAKLFNTGYEKKMASIISEGKYVTNISNYDDRIFQKEIINNINKKPDILIIGSSRTMLISNTYFPNQIIINNSVSDAGIEDIIAIYQMYKTKELLPNKIIIGIDPWLFNENNGAIRWLSLIDEYNAFSNKTSSTINSKKKIALTELLSFSYFQNSLKYLPKVITGNTEPIATTNKFNKDNTKLLDGSLVYAKGYREVSLNRVKIIAKHYSSNKIYKIENFSIISNRILEEFNLLCSEIIDQNIELSFFLAPYHPIVYRKIDKNYPMVIETESMIIEYAKKNRINLYGSFNPSIIGVKNEGFYDGMHSREKTIAKILSKGSIK